MPSMEQSLDIAGSLSLGELGERKEMASEASGVVVVDPRLEPHVYRHAADDERHVATSVIYAPGTIDSWHDDGGR